MGSPAQLVSSNWPWLPTTAASPVISWGRRMADDPRYLHGGAGHRDQGAGKDAALAFNAQLPRRQAEMLEGLRTYGPCTSDTIALKLGRPVHSSRPRMTELTKRGEAVKLDERGLSAFGAKQHLHRVSTAEERALFLARKAAESEKGGDE
jgi:hypothetical protein